MRIRGGATPDAPAVVMFHGWGGDEKSMWVLEHLLPNDSTVIALRGLYPLASGGYQWSHNPGHASTMQEFEPAVTAWSETLGHLGTEVGLQAEATLLMGFSQGAALAFAIAARRQQAALGLISLAGFLPQGDIDRLNQLPIFWGHGTQDSLVPIEIAQRGVRSLTDAGAVIHYCEADVGHKLGAECARGLGRWIASLPASGQV
jgi:phospholipase/carboxylesterase